MGPRAFLFSLLLAACDVATPSDGPSGDDGQPRLWETGGSSGGAAEDEPNEPMQGSPASRLFGQAEEPDEPLGAPVAAIELGEALEFGWSEHTLGTSATTLGLWIHNHHDERVRVKLGYSVAVGERLTSRRRLPRVSLNPGERVEQLIDLQPAVESGDISGDAELIVYAALRYPASSPLTEVLRQELEVRVHEGEVEAIHVR